MSKRAKKSFEFHSPAHQHGTRRMNNVFGAVYSDNDSLSLSSLSPAPKHHHHHHHHHHSPTPDHEKENEKDENNDDDVSTTSTTTRHQQLLHFVNHTLQSVGLSTATVNSSTDLPTLNIIYHLLNQRKTDAETLESARCGAQRAIADKERLLSDKTRMRSQVTLLEQDLASSRHTCKCLEASIKKSRKQFVDIRNMLEMKLKKLKTKDTGYVAAQRKNELMIEQLKLRIQKLMKQSGSPRSSPRNSPRNSFLMPSTTTISSLASSSSSSSSSSISLRQSQQWLTASSKSTSTSASKVSSKISSKALLESSILSNLETTVSSLQHENNQLRHHLEEFVSECQEWFMRTTRLERMWLSSSKKFNARADLQNHEYFDDVLGGGGGGGGGGGAAMMGSYSLPFEWVNNDLHTIRAQCKNLQKRTQHLEKEIMEETEKEKSTNNGSSKAKGEAEEEEKKDTTLFEVSRLANLLETSRDIIFCQDNLIQSTISKRTKARKLFTDHRRSKSTCISSSKVSNTYGTLSPLDVESLLMEEAELSTEKKWLNEERELLKVERVKLEQKKMKI